MSKSEFSSKTLSELSVEKLLEKFAFLKKEIFNLRFQKTMGELTNTARVLEVRRNIARIKTELTIRKLEQK